MDDDSRKLVLVLLKRLNRKVDRLAENMRDVKQRLTAVETSVARVQGDLTAQSRRIDELDARLERIEHGLDPKDSRAPYRS